jgi:glycosyltransferase involved in cell wall biosynthesis
MESPTITLVICAYNEAEYIGTCLEYATRNSSGELLEIVVIDNASTDLTGIIASRFTGVRVVREEQKGLTRARQRGFTEARGDIVAYIDADTRMPEGWCAKINREFGLDKRLALLSGPYRYYDIPTLQQFLVSLWYYFAMPVYWLVGYMATGGNFAIRKSVLQQMHGFDTSIEFYGEDTNIARRAHEFGKVQFDLRFVMPTSGRRFKEQGLGMTAWLYAVNFFSEVLRRRPASRQYIDIR